MFMALCALILEFVVFSLEHWFIDLSLFLQLSFLTLNLCLVILNSDSQKFWLVHRLYSVYIPFGLISILTIVQIAISGKLLREQLDQQYTPEQQSERSLRMWLVLAQLIPSVVILGQGFTFALYFKVLFTFRERHDKFEVIERLRMKE